MKKLLLLILINTSVVYTVIGQVVFDQKVLKHKFSRLCPTGGVRLTSSALPSLVSMLMNFATSTHLLS